MIPGIVILRMFYFTFNLLCKADLVSAGEQLNRNKVCVAISHWLKGFNKRGTKRKSDPEILACLLFFVPLLLKQLTGIVSGH